MPTFLMVTQANPTPEDAVNRLKEAFPDHQQVADNAWAVRAPGNLTSREVAHKIFPPDANGRGPRSLVVRFDGYGGYHQPSTWEWLSAQVATE